MPAGPMPLPMCALRIDWTLLRLFPPQCATWARKGTQAVMPISGANAKRVLFGAIDLRPFGIRRQAGQSDAQGSHQGPRLRRTRRRFEPAMADHRLMRELKTVGNARLVFASGLKVVNSPLLRVKTRR
jgi:ribosomal protein L28